MTIVDPNSNEPQTGADTRRLVVTDALELRPVAGWCACGRQVEILPPQSLRFATVPNDKWSHELEDGSLDPLPGYGDPALCLSCRVEPASAERRAWLLGEYRPLLQDAANTGMEHVTIWPIYSGADTGFRWRFLMTQVAEVPTNLGDWPSLNPFWFKASTGAVYTFLVYETSLWCNDIDGSLVWRSHPASNDMTLEVLGWQRLNYEDRCRLMRGIDLYTTLRSRGGRNHECMEPVRAVIRQFTGIVPPSQGKVARLAYASHDPTAAKDALRKCLAREKKSSGRTWADILREEGREFPAS